MKQRPFRSGERGNVMIFIFLAIVLFAALSFAVSDMMRGGSAETITTEKIKMSATDILDYTRSIRQAVQAMRINGCEDTEISFENNFVAGYTNGNAPSDNSCHVFHIDGGGISYLLPSEEWLDTAYSASTNYREWFIPRGTCIIDVGNGGVGCQSDGISNEELFIVVSYLKRDICIELNDKLKINNPGGNPPDENVHAWNNNKFTGFFVDNIGMNAINDSMYGCFEGDGAATPPAGTYHFYQVLIPR